MVISADLDGLLSAAFLHHHLGWELMGYYDLKTLWVSAQVEPGHGRVVWVDLDICQPGYHSIGHHVLTLNGESPTELADVCNPNLLTDVGVHSYPRKYPFSTILFLLWLHKVALRRELVVRLLVLQADSVWMNYQQYPENCQSWWELLPDYDWPWLFQRADTEQFEQRMQAQLYSRLQRLEVYRPTGQVISRHLGLKGGQLQFNPDWDTEVILRLEDFIGTHLKWSPPRLPLDLQRVEGERHTGSLKKLAADDFPTDLIGRGVFSYAITSTDTLNFTILQW